MTIGTSLTILTIWKVWQSWVFSRIKKYIWKDVRHLLWRGVGLCRERCKSFFVVSTACIYTSDFVRRKCLFVWRYCQRGFWKLSFKYFVTNASPPTSASPPPDRVPGLSLLGRSCSCCSACAEKTNCVSNFQKGRNLKSDFYLNYRWFHLAASPRLFCFSSILNKRVY